MNIIQGIETGDTKSIIISASVLSGVMFGIYKRQGLLMTGIYAASFGAVGLILNKVLKIK